MLAAAGWPDAATEVAPGVIYQPSGSTLTLPDGRVVLFLGGAKSVDWPLRTGGSPCGVIWRSRKSTSPHSRSEWMWL